MPRATRTSEGHDGKDLVRNTPAIGQIRYGPGDQDREPDERQVHVAVGTRLHSDLYEADHRDERPQVPEPTHECVGSGSRSPNDHRGHAEEEERRGATFPAAIDTSGCG